MIPLVSHDSIIKQIKWKYSKLFSEAKNNDVLIIGPGGIFPIENTKKLIFLEIVVTWWKILGKKVCFFGFGVNDNILKKNVKRWQYIVKKADLFATRNSNFLKAISLVESKTVFKMPDVAFASKFNNYKNPNGLTNNNKMIGIAVANLSSEILYKQTDIWCSVVDTFLKQGYYVDLIAFYKDSDDLLIRSIYSKLSDKERVHLYEYKNINSAMEKWKNYYFSICMRFHSNVASTIFNVPFLPIAYGVKTRNLAKDIGIKQYVAFWNEMDSSYLDYIYKITPDEIMSKCLKMLNDREMVKNKISKYSVVANKNVESAFEKLFLIID